MRSHWFDFKKEINFVVYGKIKYFILKNKKNPFTKVTVLKSIIRHSQDQSVSCNDAKFYRWLMSLLITNMVTVSVPCDALKMHIAFATTKQHTLYVRRTVCSYGCRYRVFESTWNRVIEVSIAVSVVYSFAVYNYFLYI